MKRQILVNVEDAVASMIASFKTQLAAEKLTLVNIAHNDIRLIEGAEHEAMLGNLARNALGGLLDNRDHVDDAIEVLASAAARGGANYMAESIADALAYLRGEKEPV